MTTAMNELMLKIQNTPEAKAEFETAATLDERAQLLTTFGKTFTLPVTLDQARQHLATRADKPMSEDELEEVAGGLVVTVQADFKGW